MNSLVIKTLTIALLFASKPALAKEPYKWVPLNEKQMSKLEENCFGMNKEVAQRTGTYVGVASALAGATSIGAATVDPKMMLFLVTPGPFSILALTAFTAVTKYMVPSEIYELIVEQQMGTPGLISRKLQEYAVNAGADPDEILAMTNKAAILDGLCKIPSQVGPGVVDDRDIEDLPAIRAAKRLQEAEKKSAAVERTKRAEREQLSAIEQQFN